MSAGAWLDLDLLRQRREQTGQRAPEILPTRIFLLRGALIGSVLPVLLLLACGWQWWQAQRLASEEVTLQAPAAEHDAMQQQLTQSRADLERLISTNEAIASAMADVRSSSALLTDLSQRIPSTVTLTSMKSEGNALELVGVASQPTGLRDVNAFLLRLAGSSMFDPSEVRLQRAELERTDTTERLRFTARALFAPDAARATLPRLPGIGADGLASRVRVLQKEGLLK